MRAIYPTTKVTGILAFLIKRLVFIGKKTEKQFAFRSILHIILYSQDTSPNSLGISMVAGST